MTSLDSFHTEQTWYGLVSICVPSENPQQKPEGITQEYVHTENFHADYNIDAVFFLFFFKEPAEWRRVQIGITSASDYFDADFPLPIDLKG